MKNTKKCKKNPGKVQNRNQDERIDSYVIKGIESHGANHMN